MKKNLIPINTRKGNIPLIANKPKTSKDIDNEFIKVKKEVKKIENTVNKSLLNIVPEQVITTVATEEAAATVEATTEEAAISQKVKMSE